MIKTILEIVSKYDQEIPQSQTADNEKNYFENCKFQGIAKYYIKVNARMCCHRNGSFSK